MMSISSTNQTTSIDTAVAKPSFDNFFSPENTSFYAASPYKRLTQPDKQVRLLRLIPNDDEDEPLVCEFTEPQVLDDVQGTYLALSYCAGDPKVTESITVNGLDFNGFASLGFALRQMRATVQSSRQRNGQSQYFWVDQICINQSDMAERESQVNMMHRIYERAGRVMIWLGGQGNDGRGLKFLKHQCNNIKELAAAGLEGSEDEANPDSPEAVQEYVAELLGKTLAEEHFEDTEFVEAWMGVRQVILSPWWSRCWVVQELVVAQSAAIFFGNAVISWDDFKVSFPVVLEVLRTITRKYLALSSDDVSDDSAVQHTRAMLGNMDLSLPSFMIEQQEEWKTRAINKPLKLRPLLQYSRRCQSSDPRDHVYAFTGLAEPGYSIVPSYHASNSVADTFCHTAKRIILHDASLEILSLASQDGSHSSHALPSWVPDWCSPTERTYLVNHDYHVSRDYPAVVSFHTDLNGLKDRVIRLAGLVVDTVASRDEDLSVPHDNPIGRTVQSWLSIANIDLNSKEDELYFTGETVTQALLTTVHLGSYQKPEDENTGKEGFDFGAQRESGFNRWRERMDLEMSTCSDFRFFKSPKGYIGIADSRCCASDLLIVAFGASIPLVLRKIPGGFKLIGEAYIHGFMNGEAIQMMKDGSLQVEYFDVS